MLHKWAGCDAFAKYTMTDASLAWTKTRFSPLSLFRILHNLEPDFQTAACVAKLAAQSMQHALTGAKYTLRV